MSTRIRNEKKCKCVFVDRQQWRSQKEISAAHLLRDVTHTRGGWRMGMRHSLQQVGVLAALYKLSSPSDPV